MLRITAKIYLDLLQLSVCPQTDDIKKNAKLCYNKTMLHPTLVVRYVMWSAVGMLPHLAKYPFDKVQIPSKSSYWSADVQFMPHCHSPLLKCGHSSKGIVIAEAHSVTQSSHQMIYRNLFSLNVAVGSSSTDVVPRALFPCTN